MPKIKSLRTYGRHRNRCINVSLKGPHNDSKLDPEDTRKRCIKSNPVDDSHILSLSTQTDDDLGNMCTSSAARSDNKRTLRPRGHHRNRCISITPEEWNDDSSLEMEIARQDLTSYSPPEKSFFSSPTEQRDDFSRFLSQSFRRYRINKRLCELSKNSSLESPKVFGSSGTDGILFCSLRRSSNEITGSDSSFPRKSAVQHDVSQKVKLSNCKRRKLKRLKAPRVVKKNTNVVPPSSLNNKTPQIDWNEIENYSLVIENEIRRVPEKKLSSAAVSPTSLDKLRSVFCHSPVHSGAVNPSISPFPQIASTNPSPIHSAHPNENYVSTLCSAENTPEFTRRNSAAQKIINIKTSTPFISLAACRYRNVMLEKTSPSSRENSMRSATSKLTESLFAAGVNLNRVLSSSHNIVGGKMNSCTSASIRNTPIKAHSIFRSQVHNSVEGSKDPVLDFMASETSVSEISFLKGKTLRDSSPTVRIKESCSVNKHFHERFQHMLQPLSRENSFKAGEVDHRNFIADLRKSAHKISLNCLKKTSEPSTPVRKPLRTSVHTKTYTSAEWPGIIKPCQIAVTPLKIQSMASPQTSVCESNDTGESECTEEDEVLKLCSQEKPIPFSRAFNSRILKNCKKIGEGVYGEVFRLKHEDGSQTALKLIPVEGDFKVNGETQKTFAEILPEIVITKELSNLRGTFHNCTPNFVKVKRVMCLRGKYPSDLLQEWDRYNLAKESLNDRPDVYQNKQLFIGLECADGGTDLESMQLKNANEAVSVFIQVACTLAIAEQAVQFEHRDLHWGNILVSRCKETEIEYTLNGKDFHISSEGVFVSVIDFTLSRLGKDGCVIYTDLSQDPTLFTGEDEYQYDIYRLTRDHNKNDWESFMPYSNILWLHYLVDKLCIEKEYKNKLSKKHKSAKQQMLQWKETLLQYQSATDFVTTSGVLTGKEHFGQNSTDASGKEVNTSETQQRKPLHERSSSMNVALRGKAKKDVPSSVAKLKKSSKFIASKKIIPASRAVRGSVRKGKNPIQMTLNAFNVRI